MTNRLMISVAVFALMAGTGLANAQGGGMGREAPSATQPGGATSEHGTSGGQMNHDAARPEMKSTQSETKSRNQHAEESKQGSKNKTLSSEENAEKGKTVGQSMKNEGREDKNAQHEGREKNKNAQRNDERMNSEAEGKTGRDSQTVGQAGAGAKLSTEQRTRIMSVIREQRVAPVTHVNFAIAVGTRVPRDVTFHRLPTEVVSIYPEWRGYEYILVGEQIVVIDPRSLEIVAVLET
ncbi:MAG: DUF1236 domain-containing protein [Bradyrhizobium sp.]|nr:DUF1236 domain-containing protein [Bradyrhizobium sp.]